MLQSLSASRGPCRLGDTCICLLLLAFASLARAEDGPRVDYNRDIRPILSDTCYKCHGPDDGERQTTMRLDTKSGALGATDSGGAAIAPGKSGESEVYLRISSDDPDLRMPPADSGKSLSPEQIDLIKQWIEQGAPWQEHWSFVAPARPPLPKISAAGAAGAKSPIDYFIRARLEQAGRSPAPEADKETLLRRVTLDLTGLPPTPQEVENFLADDSPGAYERQVDRLLHSPRYGEQRARYWLDVARYGDTHGLHLDNYREMWPYRDWVIAAFNRNQPFDRFTVEQLAGDLLPNPTLEQIVATGFNRCNVTTSEGGSIDAEYYVRYAVDRVETTSTVWMGLTTGCAVCHDHKFDPISQREFYQLFDYFYSLTEKAMDGNKEDPPPVARVPTPGQESRLESLRAEIAQVEAVIQAKLAKIEYAEPEAPATEKASEPAEFVWIDDALPAGANPQGNSPWEFVGGDRPVHRGEKSHARTATGLSQHFFTGAATPLMIGEGDVLFAHVWLDPKNPPREIMLQFNDGVWEHRAYWGENLIDWGQAEQPSRLPLGELPETGKWVRLEVPAAKVGLPAGSQLNGWAFTQFDGTVYWDTAGIVTKTPQAGREFESLAAWTSYQKSLEKSDLPADVQQAVKLDAEKRSDAEQRLIRDHFLRHVYPPARESFQSLNEKAASLRQEVDSLEKQIPTTLVMADMGEKRQTYVLKRGEYDKPDQEQPVEAGIPAVLPPLPEGAPANRLGLAQWLVDPRHPLTARVTVNRMWQQLFGTGIVKTAEDFGSQGQWPSHPELLDWLAVEFVEGGWDVKEMMRLMVTSAAYRQSSRFRPEAHAQDSANRLLWRGPRFRMDAEMVRDQALFAGGLLVPTIGGPSVKPYQPDGLWEAVGYTDSNTARFTQDHGAALYRRSMYTFWKRTAPPPTMSAFDAPSRETCTARRERTNTPMQALVLMNDVQFVEAARHFARRILTEGGDTLDERVDYAFLAALGRRPDERERSIVRETLHTHLAEYRSNVEAAQKLLSIGESPRLESLDAAEHAAWTMVASLLLNLDESVTKG